MAWSWGKATGLTVAVGLAVAAGLAPAATADVTILPSQPVSSSSCANGQPGCPRSERSDPARPAHRRTDGRRAADDRDRAAGPDPATPPLATESDHPQGNPDPFAALGAASPFCRRAALRNRPGCRIAGSIAHTYPVSNYGLDIQVETRIDKVENNLFAAIQAIGALIWLGLVYALKGVLLLLEWAFSLDLLSEAMPGLRRALQTLHRNVLGTPWFLAAITVAGLWGIWRGLVQRRTIQTAAGLAATVALMLCALVVIRDPDGTVGYASRLANEASLGFMSAAATGRVEQPAESFAHSSERLFDSLVLRPWCALEFGDVHWCTAMRKEGFRNADLWLAFPADGEEREALYKLTKGEDPDGGGIFDDLGDAVGGVLRFGPTGLAGALLSLKGGGGDGGLPDEVKGLVRKDEGKVVLQEKGGTFTRVALLCIVALGLLGAICLLLYLALKLVLAALLALLLLLLAPAMLLAPAFGDAGREAFVGWAKRLAMAIAAKLVYSLQLALVVVAAGALAAMPVGWFAGWLLQLCFWWGVLLKRKELTGFLSISEREGERHGASSLVRGYHNARAARAVAAGSAGAAVALPLLLGRQTRSARHDRVEGERRAVALSAAAQLDRTAERSRRLELAEAQPMLDDRRELVRSRDALERRLAPYEAQRVAAAAQGQQGRGPTDEEAALIAERTRIERRLDSPELRHAQAVVRESERSQAREGAPLSQAELAAWRERRRRDLEQGLTATDPRSLRAAGIDPRAYARADPAGQAQFESRSRQAIERDRALLGAVPSEQRRAPLPADVRRAGVVLEPGDVRGRRQEERAAWRHERKLRRQRAHLYRR